MADGRVDVFVSLAGPDRPAVRALVQAMRDNGLSVFLDEENIQPYQGITEQIEQALRGSKTLLAYYSRHFADRPACQYELTAAFLAGQREGAPTGRIMVINPHEETDHLLPVELADDKFDRLPAPHDKASMARVVKRIKATADGVDGYLGGIPFRSPHRWWGRTPGTFDFVGRYREMWALHTALHRHQDGLTQNASSGPIAVLSGLPGIGKSALAAAYGWRFADAHLGGVYWISLAGSGSDPLEVRARFVDAIWTLALDVPAVAGVPRDEVLGAFAEHVAGNGEPCLLIVDDLPGEVDAHIVGALTVPAGDRLHLVLVTNRPAPHGPAEIVTIGGMSPSDSIELLRRYRSGSDADVGRLAERLDGHPMGLKLAGRRLRDREGLLSYDQLLQRLDTADTTLSPVTTLLYDRIAALDEPARHTLFISMVCSAAALPVALLERLLGRTQTDAAITGLSEQLIAHRLGMSWQIHGLVRDAARECLPAPDWAALAHDVAAAVLDLDEPDPAAASLLMQHAGHLSGRGDLPAALANALRHRVVQYYDRRGEPVLALPFHLRLVCQHPYDSAVLTAAARSHQFAGDGDKAYRYATTALAQAPDPALRQAALRVAAEALDALGRLADADRLWEQTLTSAASEPSAARAGTELAYARALRMRGRHAEAQGRLEALTERFGEDRSEFHTVQAAQLELARIELGTDRQAAARRHALNVLTAYRDHGLAYHRNAVEASRVFADARLTLALWDLRTDPTTWQNAAQDLGELRDWYAATHGPRNPRTLDTAVAHAQAQIALGQPDDARRTIEEVHDDLVSQLGVHHPTYLQALMVFGYAAAQRGDNDQARRHFQEAYEGHLALLGPTHPQTLRSQLGLGIALKLTGNSAEARRMIRQVRQAAPASVGPGTDLFGQALIASILAPLPAVVWRLFGGSRR